MQTYLGIDPGKTGGICVLDGSDPSISFIDLNELNMVSAIASLKDKITLCAIEKQQSRPKQSHISLKTTFRNYGRLLGALESAGIPFIEVEPYTWQRNLGLPKIPESRNLHKQAIGLAAIRRYPTADIYTSTGKLIDGRSDALMIADWCRRTHAQQAA